MANVSPVEANRNTTRVNSSTANSTNLAVQEFEQQSHPGMFPISWQRPQRGRVNTLINILILITLTTLKIKKQRRFIYIKGGPSRYILVHFTSDGVNSSNN